MKKEQEKKAYKSWTVSDELWEAIENLVPKRARDPAKVYKCAPGRGRKPLHPRRVFGGILYVLRNGCLWKAVPKEYGAGSSVHTYFQEWLKAGFFHKMWEAGLTRYDGLLGIDWEWLSADGAMRKSPLGGEQTGANPTDRGKKRRETKRPDGGERRAALRSDQWRQHP